jgi:hypothetical protein
VERHQEVFGRRRCGLGLGADCSQPALCENLRQSQSGRGKVVTDADLLGLIGCIDVLPFDFQQVPSKDESDAIAVARSLLAGGTAQDAKKLWHEIVDRARETRLGGGTLDMAALHRWLRPRFTLKDLPDYEPSWARLRALSAETESLIQTVLPSGASLDLRSECDKLLRELGTKPCLAVYGDSGTGKSAFMKVLLDTHFPAATRIWLAPEHLEQALNEAERARFGIAHPLVRVLDAAVTPENFLIIDSAEHLSAPSRIKAQQLIKQLLELNGSETPLPWRVIIIGQTEFWASGELPKLAGTPSLPRWEVRARSDGDVAAVLRASPGLQWLASQHDTLLALTNLKTLAWVVQAAGVFQAGDTAPASMVAIAEKLWLHWTEGRTALEGFLMRLALRDADFEHSVAVSTLDAADAAAFDGRPPQCPVRRNPTNNHVQFEHDLAADWARFQKLKEIATDTAQWAAYAENPLWNGSLRMLGQFLLRERSGSRTAWDDAFDNVQAAHGGLPLADDILLDALFLDPAATTFLEERADMLFANHAKHLQRLLTRFEHVATVSGVAAGNEGPLRDFGIFLEAKFRTPIVGRWPALAAFLSRHQQRVAHLVIPRVSMLCERWLTTMPLTRLDGTPFPYRPEFAECLSDGTERQFRGRYNAFAWSQANDHANGQLYSALAALEKWLCSLVDRGADVSGHIDTLMRNGDSVAILGVLINVGKRLPELFTAVLKPLLTVAPFYAWDEGRVRNSDYSFDGMTWIRSGEIVFEMARDWYAAPYRQKNLIAIVSELCRKDQGLGDFVNAAAARWTPPDGDKERIEFQIRAAQLDYRNYRVIGAGNEEQAPFVCPTGLAGAIAGFDQSKRRAREVLAFPENCRRFLAAPAPLAAEQITAIADLMAAADGGEDVGLDEEMVRPARVAAAVVLFLGAKEWLAANESVRDRTQAILNAAMEDTALEKGSSYHRHSMAPSYLEFVAYLVFHEWFTAPSVDTDSALLRILTCGDDRAAGVIAGMAYAYRVALADRWWRLLYVALLWSGLIILRPRVGREDSPDQNRWLRRAHWLLTRRVSSVRCTVDDIRPLDIANHVEEFEARQWEEEYRREGRRFTRDRSRRMSGALETHFLEIAFAWLLIDRNLPEDVAELEQRRLLLKAFWAHKAWWLVGSESETTGDYAPMGQFGYRLVDAVAAMVLVTDATEASSLWQPIFDIGPKGQHAIGHFFTCFFLRLNEGTDPASFVARWRPMIEAVMAGRGWEDGPWYHQQSLERHALGFAQPDALARLAAAASLVASIRDLYRAWALKRLPEGEDNLAAFCGFLSTTAGAPLRLDALVWIASAFQGDSKGRRWYRDRTSAAFVEFLTTVIAQDGTAAVAQQETRQALIDLVGLAVSKQLPAALPLQDRLRTLL